MEEYRLIPLRGKHGAGKFAKVSSEDYEWLTQWQWRVSTSGYVVRDSSKTERQAGKPLVVNMHREVMQTPEGMDTDHRYGDKLDNRRSELRVCTPTQNKRNGIGKPATRFSRFKGATYDSENNRWFASIRVDGKVWFLGRYDSDEGAARAYDSAALYHYGDFALPNFSDSKPVDLQSIRAKAGVGNRNSQYRGVTGAVRAQGWRACIEIRKGGKSEKRTIGYFPTELEAAQAFDRAMLEATKRSDVKLNFPRESYM